MVPYEIKNFCITYFPIYQFLIGHMKQPSTICMCFNLTKGKVPNDSLNACAYEESKDKRLG